MEEKKDTLATCGGCNAHADKDKKSVPYIVHEGDMARIERNNRRLWILCIVMFLAFVVSNCLWLHYESQFEDVVETNEITQDVDSGDGGNAIINDGVHVNGEDKADGKNDNKNTP